jgi:hypothetical protein
MTGGGGRSGSVLGSGHGVARVGMAAAPRVEPEGMGQAAA